MTSFSEILYTLILYPLKLFLELVYAISYRVLESEGLSIIAVSLAVNLLMLPIYNKADSLRDAALAKQKAMEKGIAHIKKAFSGDERFLMLSEYYAQNRYSPLSSLIPSLSILMQVPFFAAAYSYLSSLQELSGKGFLFIRNLGSPDALVTLPFFTLNVLPVAMTLINCVSGAIYTKGHGIREKLQVYLLAVLFLVLLYKSPSGLVLYWTCNNIFSLLKNIWAGRTRTEAPAPRGRLGEAFFSFMGENRVRTGIFVFSCMLLCLLDGFALPVALLSSSVAEFSSAMEYADPVSYAFICFLQAAGLFAFWPLCIYFLFVGNVKVQGAMSFAAAFLALASLVNAYAFTGSYGDVSSALVFLKAVDFKSFSFFSLLNLLVLLSAIALLVLLLFRRKLAGAFMLLQKVLLVALLSFSVFNAAKIHREYREFKVSLGEGRLESVSPVFHLSRNHPNVVLIMLDRAQPQFVSEIFKEKPELEKSFAGFTLYENALSFNAHTLAGLPPLFGGYEYTPEEMNRRKDVSLAEKNNESQLLLPRVLNESLAFTSVVADPQYGNYSPYCDTSFIEPYAPAIQGCKTKEVYSSFWYREKNSGNLSDPRTDGLRRNLLFFSFFRSSPVCMRKAVYKSGSYWSTAPGRDIKEFIDSYSVLDYMKELTSVSDTDSGCYMSMVNEITHCSLFLQAPDYIPTDEVTDRGSSAFRDFDTYPPHVAAFRMLADWLDYLRAEGVYDNTRIIIASDHGCRGEEQAMEADKELDARITGGYYNGRGHFHPLLMFKDFGRGEGGEEKAFIDDKASFMTNADAPSLLLGGLVENPVNPFTGRSIPTDTSPLKEDGVIISANDGHRPADHGKYRYSVKDGEWWRVKDSVFSASAWTQVEPPEGTK